MAREIKILIPDDIKYETVDISIQVKDEEKLRYRLEVFNYSKDDKPLSRAEFVKNKIDTYSKDYNLVDIGLEEDNRIPVLFVSKYKG
jgi:hypothetical protein